MYRINKKRPMARKSKAYNEVTSLHDSFEKNRSLFKGIFQKDDAIIYRNLDIKNAAGVKICIIFAKDMVDSLELNKNVIEPLLEQDKAIDKDNMLEYIENTVTYANIEISSDVDKIVGSVLYGDTLILAGDSSKALLADTKGFKIRSISEPLSENVVRGPRDAFTESILINISLIRRRITNPDLKFRFRSLGKRTKTKICVCYLESLANPKILKELNKRLEDIDIDSILESGYVEEFIRDSPLSPFSTIGHTERPDKVAGNILEGRIGLIVDGTPFVLTLPFIFMEYFQSGEDYYYNFFYASINRLLRWFAFFLSTSVPAIYVALTTFHQEMVPTPLLLSIYASREGVPFPTIVEAILMLAAFEILREGGARLPAPIGTTISFVGAIVLGEAAVVAKIVSAPIVIIVALTGLSNFLIPKMIGVLNIIRIIFLGLAAFLGLYGYIFGIIGLFIHLMSMRSFGIPYMANIGSLDFQDVKDTVIRSPWWVMNYRPKLIGKMNMIRERGEKNKKS